ncbi:MAG TPA: Calx-beta domain-containing protein [Steroidobacteraceae bacterium]|jgi:hypothetical protein|nr:Calx-beta domain-containing protein [Steroidobacteraceae bacterium]
MIQQIHSTILFRSAAALLWSLALASYSTAADSAPAAANVAMPALTAASTAQTKATPVDDHFNRHCWTSHYGSANVSLCASNYSASQAAGTVSLTVMRRGAAAAAVSVDYATANGTAVSGTDYTAARGTLKWAENDSTLRTVAVPIANTHSFAGSKTFTLALSDPSSGVAIGSPGSATVSIAGNGSAVEGSLELSESAFSVAQNAGLLTVHVNRTGGSSGAMSVGYASSNGTAIGGTDFSAVSGVLKWADGDASAKSFSIPISNANPFSNSKTFTVALNSAAGSGAMVGTPSSASVTIVGDKAAPVGSVEFGAASYSVAQNAGKATMSVDRTGGSNGALSVTYTAKNGTAVAGSDFTATTGTLQWADGDASAKSVSIPVSNATPFSGTKSFTVALSSPSIGATISNPGTATMSIAGDAALPVGSVSLSSASDSVAQNVGSVTLTVNRSGGSHGAISVTYGEVNGSAVAGSDFTATSGKLNWADGEATPKSFAIPVSNAKPFSGSRSFRVDLSGITGGAAMSNPTSAVVSIAGDAAAAVGSVQLSATGYTVAQSSGSVTVTANRTGGTNGAISVHYAATNGSADAGSDFTASSGTLQWANGDASSKTFSVPVSDTTPFSGTKNFTLTLSSPSGGATLSSPSTAMVTINGSNVGATTWVYYNGVFNWGGDWSFAASPNYKDTAGGPIEGPYDIIVTSQQWGGWQPFVSANCQSNVSQCFNTLPYKYLVFSAKPTVANEVFDVGFMSSGDTTDGVTIFDSSSYCSGGRNPAVGQWESCKIPLSAFKLTDTTVLKFWISDQTGLSSNRWYLDNVGFTAN